MKILKIVIFFLLIVNSSVFSQIPPSEITSLDYRNESGVVEMTKTDLEHFMQTLTRLKQQRINQLYGQPYAAPDSIGIYADQELEHRLAKIETLLLKLYGSFEEPSATAPSVLEPDALQSDSSTDKATVSSNIIYRDTLARSAVASSELKALESRLALLESRLQSTPERDSMLIASGKAQESQVTKAYLDQQLAEIYARLEQRSNEKNVAEENQQSSDVKSEELTDLENELNRLRKEMDNLAKRRDQEPKVIYREDQSGKKEKSSELKAIEYRLALLELQQLAGATKKMKSDTNKLQPNSLQDTLLVDSTNLDQQLAKLIASLAQQSKDTTNVVEDTSNMSTVTSDDINALRSELIDLRELVAKLTKQMVTEVPVAITPAPSIPTSSGEKAALEALKVRIHQQGTTQIFYGNNQSIIPPDYQLILDRVSDTLLRYEVLDVLVVGYASKQGSPSYNQQIAAKRADLVKLYLMKKGIHPARIITQYYGIDQKAIQPKDARRVELNYLMKE